MGENASKIGAKLEGWGSNLFRGFRWIEVTRDLEIKCNRKATHENKRTHGLDILCSFYDPYLSCKQGVIIECKNRQMKSINQSTVDAWILELENSIECAHAAPELEPYLPQMEISTGLLLIHANDEFNRELFAQYLRNARVKLKRNKTSIYIASNDEIDRWDSLITYTNSLGDKFRFHYPSINESNIINDKQITLNYLFSKYVLAETVEYETEMRNDLPMEVPKRRRIMFIFDKPSIEAFRYAWSMSKHFQFYSSADRVSYVFYPNSPADVKFIKDNFFSSISNGIDHPMSDDVRSMCDIDFLTNRHLSPVDN